MSDETPSTPGTENAIFCLSPDPPAPCDRLDGAIFLGDYGAGDQALMVRIHLAPVSFSDEQVVTNLALGSSCGCDITAETTADGRRAWVVQGGIRNSNFTFLLARLTDTAYVSVLWNCGFSPCPSPFPLDHARQLVADLIPTHITTKLVRWLAPADSPHRILRVPFLDRACDYETPYSFDVEDVASYVIEEHVADLVPRPLSQLEGVCVTGDP